MLITIEQILNPELLGQFRQRLAAAPWQDGRLTAGSQAAKIKANLQLDDSSSGAQEMAGILLERLANHATFISAALPHKIFSPKFNCYQDSGHYGLHIDNAVMPMPGCNEMMRSDLSATLFLSEPEEYEGGELVIESQYGAQTVKLAAGDMILYPSNSLHQVLPVTHGARLASFFWIQSMIRDIEQRAMLFDLDQSIQALTAEKGGSDIEVMRLSGVYHNLVRLWAEL